MTEGEGERSSMSLPSFFQLFLSFPLISHRYHQVSLLCVRLLWRNPHRPSSDRVMITEKKWRKKTPLLSFWLMNGKKEMSNGSVFWIWKWVYKVFSRIFWAFSSILWTDQIYTRNTYKQRNIACVCVKGIVMSMCLMIQYTAQSWKLHN